MPPVETEADRASFFNADEFAQAASINGRKVHGYFSETTEMVEGIAGVPVQTTNPTFQCQSSLVPSGAGEGTPVTIERDDGTTFDGTIVNIEPDGFGLSMIYLQSNG